ncbi:hypothetical protein [Methylobacterium organophilum]|nr:hypothetical protein [Methylobacterium organophilum]
MRPLVIDSFAGGGASKGSRAVAAAVCRAIGFAPSLQAAAE